MPGVNPVGIGLFPPAASGPLRGSSESNGIAVEGQYLFNVTHLRLTNAQILALPGAATTVIGTITPPVGFLCMPFQWWVVFDTRAGAYGAANFTLGLRYRNTTLSGNYFTVVPAGAGAAPAALYATSNDVGSTLNSSFSRWNLGVDPFAAVNNPIDILGIIGGGAFVGGAAANYYEMWIGWMAVSASGILR